MNGWVEVAATKRLNRQARSDELMEWAFGSKSKDPVKVHNSCVQAQPVKKGNVASVTPKNPVKEGIDAWADFFWRKWRKEGHDLFLLSFMFKPLGRNDKGISSRMADEVERVYATFLTRVIRNPRAEYFKGHLPILLALPDRPIYKQEKHSVESVRVNNGLHMHGILAVPPYTRLKTDVVSHFEENSSTYLGDRLFRIDIKPIKLKKADIFTVVDYQFKSLKNSAASWDDVILFPKAAGERTVRRSSNTGFQ
jgi:hypothetical protein